MIRGRNIGRCLNDDTALVESFRSSHVVPECPLHSWRSGGNEFRGDCISERVPKRRIEEVAISVPARLADEFPGGEEAVAPAG